MKAPHSAYKWSAALVLASGFGLVSGCDQFGSGGWLDSQGEKWTIQALEFRGPGSTDTAQQIADTLRQARGVVPEKVRVRSFGDVARIYYGTYYRRVKPRTREREDSPELERDLKMLKELVDERGRHCFLAARRVLAPSEAADRPEWNLRNSNAKYSLQVGVYYNDASMYDRRKAAVEKCAELRAKGYEAYYFHGETCSMVTVGAFGPEAVVDEHGKVRFIKAPDGSRRQVAYRYSREVESLRKKPDCEYNLTNDNIEYNIGKWGRRVPVRSLLVRVEDLDRTS